MVMGLWIGRETNALDHCLHIELRLREIVYRNGAITISGEGVYSHNWVGLGVKLNGKGKY